MFDPLSGETTGAGISGAHGTGKVGEDYGNVAMGPTIFSIDR